MERMVSRIPSKKISPRELLQLGRGLQEISRIQTVCDNTGSPYLNRLAALLNPCQLIADQILAELVRKSAGYCPERKYNPCWHTRRTGSAPQYCNRRQTIPGRIATKGIARYRHFVSEDSFQ